MTAVAPKQLEFNTVDPTEWIRGNHTDVFVWKTLRTVGFFAGIDESSWG